MKHTTDGPEKTSRLTDRQRRHVERALDFALTQEAIGTLQTLAWASAGRPKTAGTLHQIEVYQLARARVQANSGKIKPGDVALVLDVLRQRREARKR
jgi:hypothetical protein